jgi:hypothetical protein
MFGHNLYLISRSIASPYTYYQSNPTQSIPSTIRYKTLPLSPHPHSPNATIKTRSKKANGLLVHVLATVAHFRSV